MGCVTSDVCMHLLISIHSPTGRTHFISTNLNSQSQVGGSKHLNEWIEIDIEIETKEKTTNPMADYLLLLVENAMPNPNRTFIPAANGTGKKSGGTKEEEEEVETNGRGIEG